jgi:hypothetical protein
MTSSKEVKDTCKCLECGGTTRPIVLISGGIGSDGIIKYAPGDGKRSIWTGSYNTKGQIGAELCETCGRIALRAQPFAERD